MGEENVFYYRSPVGLLRVKTQEGYLTGLAVAQDAELPEAEIPKEKSPGEKISGKQILSEKGSFEDSWRLSAAGPGHAPVPEETQVGTFFLSDPVVQETVRQLDEYFAGKRREFSVPIKTQGTDFQEKVWAALRKIPYGETRTYGQIAAQVGNPKAGRAVGGANHNNPIMILTPCHRVIGADGSLTGFGGGLDVKEALLALEKRGSRSCHIDRKAGAHAESGI